MANIIEQLEAAQVAKLAAVRTVPEFQPGDTVIVNVKVKEGERTRVQAYEGVCIARNGGGLNESFTVRKISYGEGVERVFPRLFAEHQFDQGRAPRQGPARQALLSARPARQVGPYRREAGDAGGQGRARGGQCPGADREKGGAGEEGERRHPRARRAAARNNFRERRGRLRSAAR